MPGWLPSAPQLKPNPLEVAKAAEKAGVDAKDYVADALKAGTLQMSCEDPDDPANWPRNLFVWRSNLLGSSGKGHEYFLKHLLGTDHGVMGRDLGKEGRQLPKEAKWHDEAPRMERVFGLQLERPGQQRQCALPLALVEVALGQLHAAAHRLVQVSKELP